jgi:hypothetical protein
MAGDKKNRNAQNKDVVNKSLAEATKQENDTEKKHADAEAGFIMCAVSSAASGLVSRCRIPTAAVAQRGLFRILLGSSQQVTDSTSKDIIYVRSNNDTPILDQTQTISPVYHVPYDYTVPYGPSVYTDGPTYLAW